MTQDDMPAPAVVDEEPVVVLEETAVIEYVPPSPPSPVAKPKPAQRNAAPDPFAVGVRVLKMAPAWLLFTPVCCSVLVLLLCWVRSGREAEAVTRPSNLNVARAAKRAPASAETAAKAETASPASDSPASTSGPKATRSEEHTSE